MKTLENLGTIPSSSILLKKKVVTSKIIMVRIGGSEIKPNSKKFDKLIVNATTPLINHKVYEDTENSLLDTRSVDHDVFNGKLLRDGFLFRETFFIRSYEIGPDRKMSIGSMVNLLQESALNHFKSTGILKEGFGSTTEMSKKDLVWVVYKMNILVDNYPSWGDVVEVDTWACEWGTKGMRRNWLLRNQTTGKILLRASSVYLMMNKKTRRLSNLTEEARDELKAMFKHCDPIIDEDGTQLRNLDAGSASYIRTGLSPQWTDVDVNQHVSHIKYIDWVLEGVPERVVKTHKLSGIRLEFRKECRKNSRLDSLSDFATCQEGFDVVELDHAIRLQNGSEILRGRTMWTPRR